MQSLDLVRGSKRLFMELPEADLEALKAFDKRKERRTG
jgi:hypothetical protein